MSHSALQQCTLSHTSYPHHAASQSPLYPSPSSPPIPTCMSTSSCCCTCLFPPCCTSTSLCLHVCVWIIVVNKCTVVLLLPLLASQPFRTNHAARDESGEMATPSPGGPRCDTEVSAPHPWSSYCSQCGTQCRHPAPRGAPSSACHKPHVSTLMSTTHLSACTSLVLTLHKPLRGSKKQVLQVLEPLQGTTWGASLWHIGMVVQQAINGSTLYFKAR